jgi:UDP-N-acetylglucosamine 2-epimerase
VHERPEGFDEAAVMLVGLDVARVMQSLAILDGQARGSERALRLVEDYAPANVSDKVLRIVQSYTDVVNRRVWRR